jgi:hypothetical protein
MIKILIANFFIIPNFTNFTLRVIGKFTQRLDCFLMSNTCGYAINIWQKFLTAVPYKFNVFYFLIRGFIYEIHRNIFILRS